MLAWNAIHKKCMELRWNRESSAPARTGCEVPLSHVSYADTYIPIESTYSLYAYYARTRVLL